MTNTSAYGGRTMVSFVPRLSQRQGISLTTFRMYISSMHPRGIMVFSAPGTTVPEATLACMASHRGARSRGICKRILVVSGYAPCYSQSSLTRTDKPHVCKICHKGFSAKQALTQHMYIHSDQKPLECNICFKTFRYPSALSKFIHKSSPSCLPIILTGILFSNAHARPFRREAAPMPHLRQEVQRIFKLVQAQAYPRGQGSFQLQCARLLSQLSPSGSAPSSHEDAPEGCRRWPSGRHLH